MISSSLDTDNMCIPGGRKLRLAVYGYIEKTSGSLAGANYHVLQQMLQRGHEIDLYAVRGWVEPKDFLVYPNYRYIGLLRPSIGVLSRIPDLIPFRPLESLARPLFSMAATGLYYRVFEREIQRRHRCRAYDAVITLGLLSPFHFDSLPQVSWTQGPPDTEWDFARRHRTMLIRQSNRVFFWGMGLWYWWKKQQERRRIPYSQRIVGGSRWALESWLRLGAREEQFCALAYPVDIEAFRPPTEPEGHRPFRLLHLGRIVPRKRFDLLMESFQLFRKQEPDAQLIVVGGFHYATKAKELLDDPALSKNVRWVPRMNRTEVAQLFREVDLLIQPSENENFGSAVAEALASGVPVLVGPSNGTKEYVSSSRMIFEEYEPESICRRLCELAKEWRGEREKIRAEIRTVAERNFAVARIVDRFLALIADAVGESGHNRDRSVSDASQKRR